MSICPRFHHGEPGPYCTRCGGRLESWPIALLKWPRRELRWQCFKRYARKQGVRL